MQLAPLACRAAFALALVSPVLAQVSAPPTARDSEPFVRQLGATTFPGGEASGQEMFDAIARLPDGAVVAVGWTEGSLGEASGGGTDFFVARFDADGRLSWLRQVGAVTAALIPALNGQPQGPGGSASSGERPCDVAVDWDGSILVTGTTGSSLGETNAGSGDLFVARFTADGELRWLRQIGVETAATIPPTPGASDWGDASSYDVGEQLALDPGGGFWVSGATFSSLTEPSGGADDIMLVRFDVDGRFEWVRQVGSVTGGAVGFDASTDDSTFGLALSPLGHLVVGSLSVEYFFPSSIDVYSWLWTFDLAGTPRSFIRIPGQFRAMALDAAGRVYVGGSIHLSYKDVRAACYDPSATQRLWVQTIDPRLAARAGLLDVGGSDSAWAVALTPGGGLVLAGYTRSSFDERSAGRTDIFALELAASDGALRWVRQLGQSSALALGLDATHFDYPSDVVVGPSGSITIAGWTFGSLGEPQAGAYDAFLLRMRADGSFW